MLFKTSRILILGTSILVSGCSFSTDALWPSLTGDDPAGTDTAAAEPAPAPKAPAPKAAPVQQAQAPAPMPPAQPALGSTSYEPIKVTPGAPTGTYVGAKAQKIRQDLMGLQKAIFAHSGALQNLRAKTVQDSQRYHGTVAAINARLQVGTTPGNPILVQQFNSAQTDLDRISTDITAMNALTSKVTEDSNMGRFLQDSTNASLGLSGAVDEDHVQLRTLQDETRRVAVGIERLLTELSGDVRRQTAYLSTERSNLNILLAGVKAGEIYGQSLSNKSFTSASARVSAAQPMSTTGRRPLVVIRFDSSNVNYEKPLYSAVSRVLGARPEATFDLVAVSSNRGGPAQAALNVSKARRNAEGVLRSLSEMGLPANRVHISDRPDVRARSNEVHLYLR